MGSLLLLIVIDIGDLVYFCRKLRKLSHVYYDVSKSIVSSSLFSFVITLNLNICRDVN